MKILLTDEEIRGIYNSVHFGEDVGHCRLCEHGVAKAQLKKVAEAWKHTPFYLTADDSGIPCIGIEGVEKFWQAILKEVEDGR